MLPGWLLKLLLGLVLSGWVRCLGAAELGPITFASGYGRDTVLFHRFQLLYTEAFHRLGRNFKLVALPKDEALISANKGLFDGDTSRVRDLEDSDAASHLIRVDVITNRSYHLAFTKKGRGKILSWRDIKNQHLMIGYPRGQVYAALQIKELQIQSDRVMTSTSCEELLQWLLSGRVDVTIDNAGNCLRIRRQERFRSIKPAAILDEDLGYPYLHKKHRALLPLFEAALRATLDDPVVHAKLQRLEQETPSPHARLTRVQLFTPYDFEPFVVDRSTQHGLIYDVQGFLNALSDGEYFFDVQALPRIPVERLERMRELAIVPYVAPSWFQDETLQRFDWTGSIMDDDTILVSNRELALDSLTPELVRGKTLCGSARLPRDSVVQQLLDDGIIKRTISPNTSHCLMMVAHGRADFYVAGWMLVSSFLQRSGLSGRLHVSTLAQRSYQRRILITPKGSPLLPWLNEKLELFTKSQSWQKILRSYDIRPHSDTLSRNAVN